MGKKTFLEHYRICDKNGSPLELGRAGGVITFKAVDTRFGEPVAIKRIPITDVDPAARAEFESRALAARVLDHVNIAKLLGFGTEDGHFVFVAEYLEGETLDSWVAEHGPLPPEAVLRVALQVISALTAAGFQGITHRAIQPFNLVIVPGEIAEGGWPFVKLINFGSISSLEPQFASPEQRRDGTSDFRSEIYSLGATMCFLLTGAIHSAESRLQQLTRFPKPIRNLLARMLQDNPDERPQDPVVFAEAVREAITNIERRQELVRKFGLPLVPIVSKLRDLPRPAPAWLPRRALALTALVLMLTTLAAVLWPGNLKTILQRNRGAEPIGVPIGVPEESTATVARNTATAIPIPDNVPAQPQSVPSAPTAASPNYPAASNPVTADHSNTDSSRQIVANNQTPEPPPPAAGPDDVPVGAVSSDQEQPAVTQDANGDAGVASTETSSEVTSNEKQTDSPANAEIKAPAKTKTVTSKAKRRSSAARRIAQAMPAYGETGMPPLRPGTFRARVVGTTPDGNVILRLPSGETAIVTPPADAYGPTDFPRRRQRHIRVERRERFLPPLQPFDPGY